MIGAQLRREPASNHLYRVTLRRFRDGLMSPLLDSSPTVNSVGLWFSASASPGTFARPDLTQVTDAARCSRNSAANATARSPRGWPAGKTTFNS